MNLLIIELVIEYLQFSFINLIEVEVITIFTTTINYYKRLCVIISFWKIAKNPFINIR